MAITKKEAIWAAIRLFGLFFLFNALQSIIDLAVAVYSFQRVNEGIAWGADAERHLFQVYGWLVTYGFKFIVFVALAYYFLRQGKLVYQLLANAPDDDQT